jgi:hypothetical protein
MMDHEHVDLSALDRFGNPARLEGAVRGVMAQAAPILARRAQGRPVLSLVAVWARPALAAAAVVAAVSVVGLATPLEQKASVPSVLPVSVAEALNLPTPVSDWVVEEREPTASDLILALDDLP